MKPTCIVGRLILADEAFQVTECKIWGYLGIRDGAWYCRWCIYVDCIERSCTVTKYGETYTNKLKPSMEGNSLPIRIAHWHNLDGVRFNTGPDVDFEYLDPNDSRPIYSIYVYAHNKCSNNLIAISNRQGNQFRLQWSGTSYTLGKYVTGDEPFELDATATFTGISLQSEVEDESDIDSEKIANIFAKVFSLEDFTQQPIDVQRYEEDGVTSVSFNVLFTPK